MSWTIQPLPTEGPLFEGAIRVYAEAFARPPYRDSDRGGEVRQRMVEQHRAYPRFRSFCALHSTGQVVGMTYGYHGARGQWWHDAVAAAFSVEQRAYWLRSSFELCEVAVAPAYQSFGIGRALIGRLLEGCDEDTCVLTSRGDSRASDLYLKLGFEHILRMRFFKDGHDFYVMGKRLKAPSG